MYDFFDSTQARAKIHSNNILSTAESLNLYINGSEVEKISNYNNPIKLTFKPTPPSVEIQKYKPLP